MFLKIFKNTFFQSFLMLLFFCAIAVVISVINKFDFRWDFTNYHYYNPFAFFYNRLNFDIVPGSVNTFFNPLIDIPLYLMVKYFNDNLNLIFAFQGMWFGLLLFVFYKIVLLFFDENKISNFFKVIVVMLIASTGQVTYFQIGSSTNEIQVALISFISLYMIFKMIKDVSLQKWYKFFISGIILGVGLGLKSTIVYVCVASGLSLILCYKYLEKPLKFILFFALADCWGIW